MITHRTAGAATHRRAGVWVFGQPHMTFAFHQGQDFLFDEFGIAAGQRVIFQASFTPLGVAATVTMEMAIITGTFFAAIRLSKAVNNCRSGPSAPTINGAAVSGTYCRGT